MRRRPATACSRTGTTTSTAGRHYRSIASRRPADTTRDPGPTAPSRARLQPTHTTATATGLRPPNHTAELWSVDGNVSSNGLFGRVEVSTTAASDRRVEGGGQPCTLCAEVGVRPCAAHEANGGVGVLILTLGFHHFHLRTQHSFPTSFCRGSRLGCRLGFHPKIEVQVLLGVVILPGDSVTEEQVEVSKSIPKKR